MPGIAIIGSGGMGRYHSQFLKDIDGAEILWAVDVDEATAQKLAADFDIPNVAQDYRKALDDPAVDAVYVCLPTFLHRDPVVAAAKAGKHVFCEKPIAMKLEHAQEMIDACDSAGVHFMVGFVRRFDNYWGKARELMQGGAIGNPVIWRFCAAGPAPSRPWFVDREKGGGPLIDGAVHNYDFARYTFGEACCAHGSARTLHPDHTALDTGTGIARFRSGDEIVLSWSWGLPEGVRGKGLMDVLGPKGVIFFEGELPEGVDPKTHGAFTVIREGGETSVEIYEKNNMFLDENIHFIECVRENKTPCVTGVDGKRALEIGLAILEAGESGETAKITAD